MQKKESKKVTRSAPTGARKPYVPPRLVTYASEQILAEIGIAQACSPFNPSCPTEKSGKRKPIRRR